VNGLVKLADIVRSSRDWCSPRLQRALLFNNAVGNVCWAGAGSECR